MRVAVYNRFWTTAGGGEKYGGAMAEFLSRSHSVDLLTPEPLDLEWLGERLQLDLSATTPVVIGRDRQSVSDASASYDLFINVTYLSTEHNKARRGLYVVYFPTSYRGALSPVRRAAGRAIRAARRGDDVSLRWGAGFYPRGPGVRATRWTDGDAIVELTLPRDVDVPVEIVFDHQRPAETLPVEVTIEVDGRKVATTSLGVADSRLRSLRGVAVRFAARGRSDGEPVEVRLRSDTFRPSDVVGGDDTRLLGVPVRYVRIGSGPLSYAAAVAPSVLVTDLRPAFLETYDRLLSISEFTSYWVRRNWGVDSDLLWPPVTQFPRGTKEPLILSVGRFFEAHQGHSKKQLEMVRAFRRLHDAGGATGWTLHLVGGCAPEAEGYVASVRAAAAGYPVELHVNASGSTVRDLYGRASIYWHATGLGENVERDPHRLEHFGITTVEAMSAGAVPVVFAAAGQLETVRPDVDGFHFRSERELVEATGRLIEDEALLTRMAEQAERRAEDFSLERFCERLSRLLTDIE